MLSEIEYAAFFRYSVRGKSQASRQTKDVVNLLKQNKPLGGRPAAEKLVEWMASKRDQGICDRRVFDYLEGSSILVPVPRSSPLKANSLWPAEEIAKAMVAQGWGRKIRRLLSRSTAVPKSAYSDPKQRQAQRHGETLEATVDLWFTPSVITLVDDIVTSGATLVGAASRIKEAYPNAQVKCFALVQAWSWAEVDPVREMVYPCVDRIVYYPKTGKTFRYPEQPRGEQLT